MVTRISASVQHKPRDFTAVFHREGTKNPPSDIRTNIHHTSSLRRSSRSSSMQLEFTGHEIGRQKTCTRSHRLCGSTLDPHSRGSWRHVMVRAFGIPRFSSAASGRCGYPSVLGSILPLLPLLDPSSPASSAMRTALLLKNNIPQVLRV